MVQQIHFASVGGTTRALRGRALTFEAAGTLRRRRLSLPLAAAGALLCVLLATAGGCSTPTRTTPNTPPAQTYTGPSYLRGEVGSMVGLRRGSGSPMLVGGYGLVVFPPGTNTGSSEVPSFLRQWMINEMRKRGVGSASLRAQAPEALKPFMSLTPEQVLESHDTAVVAVQGLIPPGASPGTRFDVVVRALPQTQTTSLAGGTLWTTDLGRKGLNPAMRFTRQLARAHGPIYMNPAKAVKASQLHPPAGGGRASSASSGFDRTAVVVKGGQATQERRIEMVLNQPSYRRSRLISDRVNERFGKTTDRQPIADPKTDQLIQVHIPRRWARRPGMLMKLVSHLYVRRGPGVEVRWARRLAATLEKNRATAKQVIWSWEALGRMIFPVLRTYYDSPKMYMRLAALKAGAWLEDEHASRFLDALADNPDPAVRRQAASALVHLPSSLQGAATLKRLLNDDNTGVRIAAYESLARINDQQILQRYGIGDKGNLKFIIDQVPSRKPMVYITQKQVPRVVIFGKKLGFRTPILARLWDGHLMLRAAQPRKPMTIFYQRRGDPKAVTHQVYPVTVGMLAYALGHAPNDKDMQEGLGLSYSKVVEALYQLCRKGDIAAPIRVNQSPLAKRIDEQRRTPDRRPITGTYNTAGGQASAGATGRTRHASQGLAARPISAASAPRGER